MIKSAYRI